MNYAYSKKIPNTGCPIFLRTRSEIDPIEQSEDGMINLHLVFTSGYQSLCDGGAFSHRPHYLWQSEDGMFHGSPDMSDFLRLPCEWISDTKQVTVQVSPGGEGNNRYVEIDLIGFPNIRDPEGLVRFIINRMVHKAKIVQEFYEMQNHLV